MVTVKGVIQTLTVVKNPHSILWSKLTKKPVRVTFSNGAKFSVTWSQFRFLREHYELVKRYKLEQVDDRTFKIHTKNGQLVGSQVLMCILDEIESGVYEYDYKNKVVLDVGAFEGESAVFFWGKGAKKIVIYEPVKDHLRYIQENIRLNNMNAEIHVEGIGDQDGEISVAYDQADNCFGLNNQKNTNKMNIKIREIAKVIHESGSEVAKLDCEGAEIALTKVPKETLRKLEYVMVEVHSSQIRQALIEKFSDAGFVLVRGEEKTEEAISMAHFKRI